VDLASEIRQRLIDLVLLQRRKCGVVVRASL
jgi:hypothetical protein